MLDDILQEFTLPTRTKTQDSKLVKVSLSKKESSLTAEQESILSAKEDVLKVTAYAGSGKTFVLENFAKRNIKSKGLYIAFNRDLKLEAEKRFPTSVKCLTMHGLAFSRFGKDLANKLNKPIYPQHLIEYLDVPASIADLYSKLIFNSVINFTYSRDHGIEKKHITFGEELALISEILKKTSNSSELTDITTSKILSDIELIWSHMIDEKSPLGTTHDTYLKLFQLHRPKLPYSTILLDEAQDVNPAMLDIFERQKCRKVLTGDPYQSIYQFRRAVDGMTNSKADQNYYLTKSFRFGQSIANIASTFLPLRGESRPVFGREDIESKIGSPNDLKEFLSYQNKAVITRTNAQIFAESVRFASMGYTVYVEGGEKMLNFDLLTDLSRMKEGAMPQDSFLSTFFKTSGKNGSQAFNMLEEFATENSISEWQFRCKLINNYGKELPNAINLLKKALATAEEKPSNDVVIITNVHKSKGLEYDAVLLADDFDLTPIQEGKKGVISTISLNSMSPLHAEKQAENVNLLYVALTRAKKFLCFENTELINFINQAHKALLNKPVIWTPNPRSLNFSDDLRSVYASASKVLMPN